MTRRRLSLTCLYILLLLAAQLAQASPLPKNVVVMIGDGMGFAEVTMARLGLGKADAALAMDSMRYGGMVKTHSTVTITDSAAAATAIATGHKTKNGMIATLPDGKKAITVLERAAAMGKGTGLVTTVTITHATPAGFGAHVGSRGDEADIAVQYLDAKIDVLMGGGEQFFAPKSTPTSKRTDDRDLLAEARKLGYTVARTTQELADARSQRLLGLFAQGYMTTNAPEPPVATMAQRALELLARNKKGFFLMVEGGQIDGAGHANKAPENAKQTLDFDAAVGAVLEFARKRGDTLVIVTADHETGGLALVGAPKGSAAEWVPSWATTGHSATMVPILSDGPCADRFSGVLDNTDIAKRILEIWR